MAVILAPQGVPQSLHDVAAIGLTCAELAIERLQEGRASAQATEMVAVW